MMATRKAISQAIAEKSAERKAQRGKLAAALVALDQQRERLEKVMSGMIDSTHEGRRPTPNG